MALQHSQCECVTDRPTDVNYIGAMALKKSLCATVYSAQPYGLMASEENVEPVLRAEALRRVRGFLSGTWKEIDDNRIIIKKIR